jgi:tRNA(fMet)-specific endonuclease VapC
MSGNKIFLDTNIIIELFTGNEVIADKLKQLRAFYISPIVLGELYVGINRVVNKNKHLLKLNSFLELCDMAEIDKTTAQIFGEITVALYKKGKPIPTNDIWIAASVKQYDLRLISRDKHFDEIDHILTESW